DRAATDEVVVGDRLGLDEAALEVGMDDAGGLRRAVAGVNRPGAHLFLARREERPQPEQMVGGADQRADAALGDAEILEEGGRLGGLEFDELALDLCADDHGL